MGVRTWIDSWPAVRQLTGKDRLGLGAATRSKRTDELRPRTATADKVVKSICPYCAVGCAQQVFVADGQVTQIEGDPDSPVSRGRLCPKGSASLQLTTGPARQYQVLYRPPHGTEWERLDLETGKRGADGRLLAVIVRNRRAKHHCVYLTPDISGKCTQSFGSDRRGDRGSARWVAIGIQLHLRHPKFTSDLPSGWQIGIGVI